MNKVRRLCAGIDETGNSVFLSDEDVEAVLPPTLNGNSIIQLFGEDGPPRAPHEQLDQDSLAFFPGGPGGYRFMIFTCAPESQIVSTEDSEVAAEETDKLTPGLSDVITKPDQVHETSSIDLEYVISGEFTLTLDNGQCRVLRAGDTLILRGAKHSWANKGTAPATMLLVMISNSDLLHEER